MKKDTARNYCIHAIIKIKDMIEKEYMLAIGASSSMQREDAPNDLVKKYMTKAELCSYFDRVIKMEILEEFENKKRGEYNLYD